VSKDTGSVTISWLNAGSIAKSYRIYQGGDLSKLLETVGSEMTSKKLTGFAPNTYYEFGVRLVDKFGREDPNTKTISVKISDLRPPEFAGIKTMSLVNANTLKLKWDAALPEVKEYQLFRTQRDVFHQEATIDCNNSSNASVCANLINWNNPTELISGKAQNTF
jgi:hypothetical protein